MADAADLSVYCAQEAQKGASGGPAPDWMCDALMAQLAATHPGREIQRAQTRDDADLVLDARVGPGYSARLSWRGQAPGKWMATVIRGRPMQQSDMVDLIARLVTKTDEP